MEVPDRLVRVGEPVGEEAAAVLRGEDAGVPPALAGRGTDLLRDRTEVEDVDDQQVPGLGPLDRDRPAQHVRHVEVHVAHVVGRVVVDDLVVGPLPAFHPDVLPRAHGDRGRDVGVPPVVARHRLVPHRLGLVNAEDDVGHGELPRVCAAHLARDAGCGGRAEEVPGTSGSQGRGSLVCRGSVVIGDGRREAGTSVTTRGSCALRSCASRARARGAATRHTAGAEKTRGLAAAQSGQSRPGSTSVIEHTTSKGPQEGQRYEYVGMPSPAPGRNIPTQNYCDGVVPSRADASQETLEQAAVGQAVRDRRRVLVHVSPDPSAARSTGAAEFLAVHDAGDAGGDRAVRQVAHASFAEIERADFLSPSVSVDVLTPWTS